MKKMEEMGFTFIDKKDMGEGNVGLRFDSEALVVEIHLFEGAILSALRQIKEGDSSVIKKALGRYFSAVSHNDNAHEFRKFRGKWVLRDSETKRGFFDIKFFSVLPARDDFAEEAKRFISSLGLVERRVPTSLFEGMDF